jgi:dipeptidase E
MNNIILTSTGFSNPKILKEAKRFFGSDISVLPDKKAAIITTASADKEKNEFALLAYSHLSDMGFGEVAFFDFERDYARELLDFDLVFVNGGNTYYLLDWIRKSNFDETIKEFLEKGGLYIGVSAGSIVAGPSIEILNFTGGDENAVGLMDFSGLGLIDRSIMPHYTKEREAAIEKYEEASGVEVIRLADGMAAIGAAGGDFYILDDFWEKI